MSYRLGPAVVDDLLLGPPSQRRQLQDFPVLGDVWSRYADQPGVAHDLLLLPCRDRPAGAVAALLDSASGDSSAPGRGVAYLQNLVVASLRLEHLHQTVIPATRWWDSIQDDWGERIPDPQELRRWMSSELTRLLRSAKGAPLASEPQDSRQHGRSNRMAARLGLLLGTFLGAERAEGDADNVIGTLAEAIDRLDPNGVLETGLAALTIIMDEYRRLADRGSNDLIFQVTLDREAEPALADSVPAIKADAARTLFSISCRDIAWAVVDSGIDQDHPAFIDHARTKPGQPPPNRIDGTYDFRNIRRILGVRQNEVAGLAATLATTLEIDENRINTLLEGLIEDRRDSLEVDWRKVKELVTVDTANRVNRPDNPHGTHVAGIIGADRRDEDGRTDYQGVCPDIRLYDFRVLGSDEADSEFAVSAALQFIRHLNEETGYPRIHGVNMSLSIRHNVRNYACGRTPVCLDAEGLISNGVVVVAAAGNRGYQRFQLADSETFESYAASSITDPGNADGVITVGSTHRQWPHTYGVSFFSSRGPTGDGRMKPDLLAPGEKIRSSVPGDAEDQMDGTSMAAPHVSGAAALLMARHREFKGHPGRIKQILCETATDLNRERSFQGHGMVDVLRAIQSV